MGLDIYLFRIKKPCLEKNKTYTREELLNMNRRIVTFNDVALKEAPKAIKEVAIPIIVTDKFYNREKVCAIAGVDFRECAYLSLGCESWKADDTHQVTLLIRNRFDNTIGNAILINEQIEEVLEEKDSPLFAFISEEIEYQRGNIDDYGFLPRNCEYCDDLSIVKNLTKHGLSNRFVEKWSKDTLFYAWW